MARLPRFFVPGLPLHVIQRGNDRAPIFSGPGDLAFFRECVKYAARKHCVAIHAYVFMTNHVHVLATPGSANGVPKMMQAIGRVYVQYFNSMYQRTGTLWEGRYKAAIVDDDRYLLTCMRYIEQNPVRASMVASPAEYQWSSFRANACEATDELIEPHALYRRLGGSAETRKLAYRELFGSPIADDDLRVIRDATQNAWALGGAAFRMKVAALNRRGERLALGRPRKERRDPGETRF